MIPIKRKRASVFPSIDPQNPKKPNPKTPNPLPKRTKKNSSTDQHRRPNLEEIIISTPQFLGKNISAELANLPRTDLARIKLDQPLSPTAFIANKPPISPNTTTITSPPPPQAVPQIDINNNNQNLLTQVITINSPPSPPATTNGEVIQNDHTLSNRFTIPSGNN